METQQEQEQQISNKQIEKPTEQDQIQQDENQETADENEQNSQEQQQLPQAPGVEIFSLSNESRGWKINLQSSVYDVNKLAEIWLNIMKLYPEEFDKFFSNGSNKYNYLSK